MLVYLQVFLLFWSTFLSGKRGKERATEEGEGGNGLARGRTTHQLRSRFWEGEGSKSIYACVDLLQSLVVLKIQDSLLISLSKKGEDTFLW